jgi:hypothetical protein
MNRSLIAGAVIAAGMGIASLAQAQTAYTTPTPYPGAPGLEPGTVYEGNAARPSVTMPAPGTIHCAAPAIASSPTPGPFAPMRASPCE